MNAERSIGKPKRGSMKSGQTEPTVVPASPEKMEILREISHVLAMSEHSPDRTKLLKELWRLYEATPYLMVSRVNLDELLEQPPSLWERLFGKPAPSTTKG